MNSLKIITIKSSISGIGRKSEYLPRLEKFVRTVNTLMIHTFALIKFIFISELKKSEAFDIEKYAEKDFYMQVFSSLLYHTKKPPPIKSTKTKEFRDLIKTYVNEYCELCGYTPIELKYSQQISAYECTKVDTAYKNGIILQFGNKLRMSPRHEKI